MSLRTPRKAQEFRFDARFTVAGSIILNRSLQSMPTFHFLKNGALVADMVGANANKLAELIKQHK